MWLAIAMTVLAAAGNNVGKVLQKQGAARLPRLVLKREVVVQFVASRPYMLGLVCDLCGALLMVAAFAHAPVSVVQPVSAIGLVILLIFSHFYLGERLRAAEWLAAALAGAGVLGLGATAEPDHMAPPDHLHPGHIAGGFGTMVAALGLECWLRHRRPFPPSSTSPSTKSPSSSTSGTHPGPTTHLHTTSSAGLSTGVVATAGGPSTTLVGVADGSGSVYRGPNSASGLPAVRASHAVHERASVHAGGTQGMGSGVPQHSSQVSTGPMFAPPARSNSTGSATTGSMRDSSGRGAPTLATDAVMCGLEGGACFGLSAASCRTGFLLARRIGWLWAVIGLLGSVTLTSSGFVLQTKGLKSGSTIIVCTMAAVSSVITGVLAGLLALGEALPSSPGMQVARWASWAAILFGVSGLASGTAGLRAFGGFLGALLPRWLWRLLPRSWALQLHRSQKTGSLLPLVNTQDSR